VEADTSAAQRRRPCARRQRSQLDRLVGGVEANQVGGIVRDALRNYS
jgi:hypothetical protein